MQFKLQSCQEADELDEFLLVIIEPECFFLDIDSPMHIATVCTQLLHSANII